MTATHEEFAKSLRAIAVNAENEANARLIAAAPELLEALKEAADALLYIQEFSDEEQSGPVTPRGECLEELIARLKGLIAKATGAEHV